MQKLLISICFLSFFFQNCNNKKEERVVSETTNKIALEFDSEEIFKELIRRGSKFTDSVTSVIPDTIASYVSYDSLQDKRDTILKPSETDTVLLSMVKQKFSEYTDEELLSAYQTIIANRVEIKGTSAIYGIDNREDVKSSLSQNYVKSSKGVFAIIHRRYFQNNGELLKIRSKGIYANVYKLCDTSEKFSNQNLFADCTAFVISQNKVATAGHCINSGNYRNYLLVADFTVEQIDSYLRDGIPPQNVFEISAILESGHDAKDFAVLALNKPVSQDRVVKLSNRTNYNENDNFYVIGFPCGLPMKICNTSTFRQNISSDFFQINSDTYGGNSGSPVFNENTNEVEGILVRGNRDFYLRSNSCAVSIQCPEFGCRGEDVTKVHLIKKYADK
jgi:V8-like Glu-specific endopeptidase